MEENGIANGRDIFDGSDFGRHGEKKHEVARGLLSMCGYGAAARSTREAVVSQPAISRQRQWGCAELHSASLRCA
ncbi:MAG: hypothetical protein WCA89_10640, partial [Terracidiphilus sp.]